MATAYAAVSGHSAARTGRLRVSFVDTRPTRPVQGGAEGCRHDGMICSGNEPGWPAPCGRSLLRSTTAAAPRPLTHALSLSLSQGGDRATLRRTVRVQFKQNVGLTDPTQVSVIAMWLRESVRERLVLLLDAKSQRT